VVVVRQAEGVADAGGSRYSLSGFSRSVRGTSRRRRDTGPMIRRITPLGHAAVGLAIAGMSLLAGFGVIGGGDQALLRPEHFDAKQVTVRPDGVDGIRVREVVDIDFGLTERRGYEREIPDDFGAPIDVTAFSPDANDEVASSDFGSRTRIRVGNAGVFFTGQHRYELEYTLPDAGVSSGVLAVDIIGTDETFTTDRFEVVLAGFELAGLRCDTGGRGQFGGCEFVQTDSGDYIAVIEPLDPGEGITVGGTIVATNPTDFDAAPDLPTRNPSGFRPLGLAVLPAGLLAAAGVFAASRRYGSNDVHGAGGAADAAFGDLPTPRNGDPVADVPTYRVPDSRLADLATIEFVPPRGIEPWQAAALLTERVDDNTVSAWFSEMIARDAIEVDDDDMLRRGADVTRLSAVDRAHINRIFASGDAIELGKYDSTFSSAWIAIRHEQLRFISEAGWWTRGAPGTPAISFRAIARLLVPLIFILVISGSALLTAGSSLLTAVSQPLVALVLSVLVVTACAFFVYRSLWPSRSATGSALTLRSESFRRFLAASEGRHVEWAWKNDVVREYSAWAVALGAADAWKRAVESSNIPHPDRVLHGPLFVHSSASSFQSARTAPSSSGSGGSSFGGGGGVGGGGGGGSSGSW
jgi:uncharacterized membrane protein YgcG